MFYQDIAEVNGNIVMRGAYFIGSRKDKNPSIDFFILDPSRRVIFSRRKKSEGLFNFNVTLPGQYSFVFSNLKVIYYDDLYLINSIKLTKI